MITAESVNGWDSTVKLPRAMAVWALCDRYWAGAFWIMVAQTELSYGYTHRQWKVSSTICTTALWKPAR